MAYHRESTSETAFRFRVSSSGSPTTRQRRNGSEERWPEEISCPHCGSTHVNTQTNHKSMPYRCKERECRKWFSVDGNAHADQD